MGVVEDDEPPPKRVRVPSRGRNKLLEESSLSCAPKDPMAGLVHSRGEGEMVGSKGVIRKSEFVKIITKALYSLGYSQAGALLEEESGIPLCPSPVIELTQQVVCGKWDESFATLQRIDLLDEHSIKLATFMILEQKFHELLKTGDFNSALDTLRNGLVPLRFNVSQVHKLAASMIAPPTSQDAGDAKSRSKLVEKLQKLLPVSIMVPEKRLEQLVEQALDVQIDACAFHNISGKSFSLYSDHDCGINHVPDQTLQILDAHSDEVWSLQFSHNGKYLASSSKDHSAIIWEVKEDGQVALKHVLNDHKQPVSVISWSPDGHQLLTCGLKEAVRRWDVDSGKCLHVYEKTGVSLVSCGWFADGKGIFSGMTNNSICLWHLDGTELECWQGQQILNISNMAVAENGKKIISICRENSIVVINREANFERLVKEEQVITSFSVSKDNKFLLVNLINQEIHLWSIDGSDAKVVAKYKGHKRTRFDIQSCFGGFNQTFVASGSEDSQVFIWHRDSGKLLMSLPGHSGAVNCVSWNPENLHMLASASDDRTIRVWGLKNQMNAIHTQTNGRD